MKPDVTDREHDLAAIVRRLRQDLDELKAAQRVGWDSLLTYKAYSAFAADIQKELTPGQVQQYEITYTFSNAKGGAIMELNAFYRLNNDAVMAFPNPRRTPTNPGVVVRWRKSEATDTYAKWRLFAINTSVGTTYVAFIKLFLDGTADGSFSIVEI
jgi:predicted dithiol-disulfide oxidoreductase (DUF899 family)